MDYSRNLTETDLDGEIWLPVKGYEDRYEVSNLGRVRSLMKQNVHGGGVRKRDKPMIRKSHINTSGYYQIGLQKEGKLEHLRVHRLVAIAFIPNPENLPEVNHLKGKLDNRVESIEWSTPSNNQKHAYANNLRIPLGGEKNPKCILTEKQVVDIFNSKTKSKEAAQKHGISIHTVRHIRRGSTWSYLTGKKYIPKINASSSHSAV